MLEFQWRIRQISALVELAIIVERKTVNKSRNKRITWYYGIISASDKNQAGQGVWVVGWETGEERSLFHGMVGEGCPEEEWSWRVLNERRKICAMFQAKGQQVQQTLRQTKLSAAEGQKQGLHGSNENKWWGWCGVSGPQEGVRICSKCDGSHWKVLS